MLMNMESIDPAVYSKVKGLLQLERLDIPEVDRYFSSRGLSAHQDKILNIIALCDDVEAFESLVLNPAKLSKLNVAKFSNVFEAFDGVLKKDTLIELFNFQPGKRGSMVGKGEILLSLLLPDASLKMIGDVDVNGKCLEVKCGSARLASREVANLNNCDQILEKYGIVAEDMFSGYKKLYDVLKSFRGDVPAVLTECIMAKYSSRFRGIGEEMYDALRGEYKEVRDYKKVFDVMGAVDMYVCQNVDGWKHLILFDNDGNYFWYDATKHKSLDDIVETFRTRIKTMHAYSIKSSRSWVAQVQLRRRK